MNILPEKWAVERTKENAEVVNAWSCATHKCGAFLDSKTYIHSGEGHNDVLIKGYVVISYEDFARLVLNKCETYEIY